MSITLAQLEQDIKDEIAKLEKWYGTEMEGLRAKVASVFSHPSVTNPSADGTAAPTPMTETKVYSDGSSATGPAPLPDQSPAQQAAASSTGTHA